MKKKTVKILLYLFFVGVIFFLIMNLFAIHSFRERFNSNSIVSEGEDFRCIELFSSPVNVNVDPNIGFDGNYFAIGSSNPSLDVNKQTFIGSNIGSCYFSYEVKSVDTPDVTVFDVTDINPCEPSVNVKQWKFEYDDGYGLTDTFYPFSVAAIKSCFVNGDDWCFNHVYDFLPLDAVFTGETRVKRVTNFNCALVYYNYVGWHTVVVSGKVFYDKELEDFVCRDTVVPVPVKCFSNECVQRDLMLRNVKVCVADSVDKAVLKFESVFGEDEVVDEVQVNITDEDVIVDVVVSDLSGHWWDKLFLWLKNFFSLRWM